MATVLTDSTNYDNIADAIRAQNGTTETYYPSEMAAAISALSVGGDASKITYDNTASGLTASNVQNALDELANSSVKNHASTHASTGSDPITPNMIGAAPAYTYGTDDLTAGTSELATGILYFVYE